MKKKIIIFGATGNVGSYLLKYALEYFDPDKYEVIASGRRKTDFFEKRGIPYVSVDITKEEDFAKLPTENIHAVMLLAAQIPSYMDKYEPKKYIDSIIVGGYNVLEYCRKNHVDRILYTQTVFDVATIRFSTPTPNRTSATQATTQYTLLQKIRCWNCFIITMMNTV